MNQILLTIKHHPPYKVQELTIFYKYTNKIIIAYNYKNI